MSTDSRISMLLNRWEELRQLGQEVSVHELCQDCPELVGEVDRQIRALEALDKMLDTHGHAAEQRTKASASDSKPWPARPGPAPALELPGYEIIGELGQGGMGIVYKGRQTRLNRVVALKMLLSDQVRREDVARFETEARALALVQHPNIVQIYEVAEHQGRHYLALEYVDGGTLEDTLSGVPMAPRFAAKLVETLAKGVGAAHAQGVIHRDLKPGNILLTRDGTPKIADFGLAKLDGQGVRTRTGVVMGTPSYMAPEQALGQKAQLGPRTDIYSLGAILYELLTGRPPFLGEGPLDTLDQLCREEPVPPRHFQPKVPADLETICLQCLRKEPRRRYDSARALADDLGRFLDGEPVLSRPVGKRERLWRWCKRKPSQAALVGVSLLALATLFGGGMWFTHRLDLQLKRTEAARADVQRALARQVALGLDNDLDRLAAVPLTMAEFFGQRADWNNEQLAGALQQTLKSRPRIFGMAVAFEPFEMGPQQQHYALYAFSKAGSFETKQLVPPGYLPLYREWPWYRLPRVEGKPLWSEPYVGPGADNTPMVTYSVPIYRQEKFAGVVTADLAIEFFSFLRSRLNRLELGPQSYCFVVSPKGTIIYHPDQVYEFPAKTSNLARIELDPSFRELTKQFGREGLGSGEAIDFATGQPATFLFTKVAAADWTFVVVIPR